MNIPLQVVICCVWKMFRNNPWKWLNMNTTQTGVHDTRAIEHVRTYLWDLEDYRVASVQAGVIWLVPGCGIRQRGKSLGVQS